MKHMLLPVLLILLQGCHAFLQGRDGQLKHPLLGSLSKVETKGMSDAFRQIKQNPLSKRVPFTVKVFGRDITLLLEQNHNMFHPKAKIETDALFLHGFVEGYEKSHVAVTLFNDKIMEGSFGFEQNGEQIKYHIEAMRIPRKLKKLGKGNGFIGEHLNIHASDHSEWQLVAYEPKDDISDKAAKFKPCKPLKPEGVAFNSAVKAQNTENDIKIVELDQNVTEVLFDDVVRPEPVLASSQTSTLDTSMSPTWSCALALVADKPFYDRYGDVSADNMLSLVNEVQYHYNDQFGMALPVIYLYVAKNSSDVFGAPPADIYEVLDNSVTVTQAAGWPNGYGQVSDDVCLLHVFSHQNYDNTLGLAYLGNYLSSGACSKIGYNTGVTTSLYSGGELTRKTVVQVLQHELGHNFGSEHDTDLQAKTNYFPFTPQCTPNNQYYNMYPYLSINELGFIFSNCSRYEFGFWWPRKSCLKTQVPSSSVIEFPPLDYKPGWDECANPPITLPNTPANKYWTCPFHSGLNSPDSCRLNCYDPTAGWGCKTFLISGKYLNLSDGSPCGSAYNGTFACRSGLCVPEWRNDTCIRSKECCDPFGTKRNSSYSCGNFSGGLTNPCVPFKKYCDPQDQYADSECPFFFHKPGTSCGGGCNEAGSSCSMESVCGTGNSLGFCVNNPEFNGIRSGFWVNNTGTNNLAKCGNFTCPSVKDKCVVVGNNTLCIDSTIQSCKFLCDNNDFSYTATNRSEFVSSWDCDCRSDCQERNSCCKDYSHYCVAPGNVYNPANVTKTLINLSTRTSTTTSTTKTATSTVSSSTTLNPKTTSPATSATPTSTSTSLSTSSTQASTTLIPTISSSSSDSDTTSESTFTLSVTTLSGDLTENTVDTTMGTVMETIIETPTTTETETPLSTEDSKDLGSMGHRNVFLTRILWITGMVSFTFI